MALPGDDARVTRIQQRQDSLGQSDHRTAAPGGCLLDATQNPLLR